jgi:hypothetical protein
VTANPPEGDGAIDEADGPDERLRGFDPTVPSPARMWNYWVGGKDHFAADREAAEKIMAAMPSMPVIAESVRILLVDIVQTLTADYGIRQFLDIGTGLPTAENTHEVAQRIAAESRVVYVDNDPVVLAHARALLTSTEEGKTDYVELDLRNTDAVLTRAARTLDFSQPVAVLLFSVLHFIPDADDPYAIVKRLMDAVPAGSYLVICQAPSDRADAPQVAELARRYTASGAASMHPRSHEEVTRFFDGLDLIGPGVVPSAEWLAPGQSVGRSRLAGYVGVAKKPAE